MSALSESHFAHTLRKASENGLLSRALIASAQLATDRSRQLCQTVHERRRHPDFFHYLAKYVHTSPRMRRYLPLTGGDGDLLRIETEERPEGMVAHVSGEVDLANVDRVKAAIQPAVSNCRNLILDVSHLRYIDSTGLYVLADAHKTLQQKECRLVVVGASPTITKVLRIFGLDGLAPLVSSLYEAMDLLRTRSSGDAANG